MSIRKTDHPTTPSARDWARNPIGAAVWWVIPIAIGMAIGFFPPFEGAAAAVWPLVLVWMGLGCILNARRCNRRHCYFSGPILVIGGVATALVGWGVVSLGPNGLDLTLWATGGLALLSLLTEAIWGKYARP